MRSVKRFLSQSFFPYKYFMTARVQLVMSTHFLFSFNFTRRDINRLQYGGLILLIRMKTSVVSDGFIIFEFMIQWYQSRSSFTLIWFLNATIFHITAWEINIFNSPNFHIPISNMVKSCWSRKFLGHFRMVL